MEFMKCSGLVMLYYSVTLENAANVGGNNVVGLLVFSSMSASMIFLRFSDGLLP